MKKLKLKGTIQLEKIIAIDNKYIANIFGEFDEHIKKIEKEFNIKLINRGDDIKLTGDDKQVEESYSVIKELIRFSEKGEQITVQTVQYLMDLIKEGSQKDIDSGYDEFICMTVNGRPIKSKTIGQKKYINLIKNNNIVFGVGPAGTGKTYLAMAMAITAFKNNEVGRIIMTRPAIEAGEKLGFLPGDLQQKVDPYLRPLYDALYEIMGAESYQKNLEKGAIEVAPLAYMRGRTLDNAFIVLDEAQNTTPEQMKMFLTRIGYGSKAVITGDTTQMDLPEGKKSGLQESIKILQSIEGIGFITLTNKDVIRHPLVQKIILAYEKYENRGKNKR